MIFDLTPSRHSTVAGGEQPVGSADTSVSSAGCSIDLATTHNPAVNGRGVSASPVRDPHMLAETPLLPSPAGGGNIHTSHNSKRIEAEVITAARPLVVKEILALLGNDIPDPLAHVRYLDTLSFSDLCARRDQLLAENLERLKEEELRRQPELPERPLRQKRFSYGRPA